MPCIAYQAADLAQVFSPGAFVHECTTSTWMSVATTYLNWHFQNARTERNRKGVERDPRPERESKRGFGDNAGAVDGYHKGYGPVNGE